MNPNSIIFNNMYPANGYIPPNPMGNIVGIGSTGYNQQGYMGGYYTNNYNNYYNPYLAQRQAEMQEIQQREQMRQQSNLMKKISKAVNKSLNNQVSESHYDRYNPENYYQNNNQGYGYQQYDPDYFDHNQLLDMYYKQPDGNVMNMQYAHNVSQAYEREKQRIPDDCGLADYHKYAGQIMREIEDTQIRNSQRNLNKLYNNQHYRQLVDSRSGANGYFNSMFTGSPSSMTPNINIDDMSVKLPHHLVNNTIEERRKAFFDTISSGR